MKARTMGATFTGSKPAGIIAAAGLLMLTVGSASAGVLTPAQADLLSSFDYNGYSVINNTNVSLSGPVGQVGTYGSGQIDLNGTGPNAGQILATWCIDVFDDLRGSDNYNVIFTGFTNNGSAPGGTALTNAQINDIGRLVYWGDANINTNTNNSPAAQLAIWSIEYQGTGDTFTSSVGAVNTLVGSLVTQAENGSLGSIALLKEVINPGLTQGTGNQGLVYEVGTTTALPTPLPSTWTMLIASFLGLGFFAYRGSKKNSAALATA